MIKDLTLKEFEKKNKEGIVMVDFYTEWCGDCKMMEPVYKELSEKYKEKVSFFSVNAENSGVFRKKGIYNILRVPTFILFENGKEIIRGVEYNPIQVMEGWLKKVI
ncbi:MAG: thioredoxin family protein [Mycoplasma sp.]|nr:thioredoxin family protein [Mycoplasma sp.]